MKEKVSGAVESALGLLVKILGIMLIITVALQVASRYIPGVTMVWTEELSRFLFVWYAMLSVAVAYIENKHLYLDIVYDKLGPKAKRFLDGFSLLLVFISSATITVQGYKFLKTVQIQKSPILRFSMAWFYAAIPVGFTFISIVAFIQIVEYIIHHGKKEGK